MLRGLKHPKRHLEGSGDAHTHTQEGRCRKSQMPSQYHSRKSTWRALERKWGSGMQHKAGRGSWGTAQPLPCPGDSWEHPKLGCDHGALPLTSRESRMCPRGQIAASVPLLAIPRFGSVSPRCWGAELQGPAGEITAAPSFQGLFSCPACGNSAQVLVGRSL